MKLLENPAFVVPLALLCFGAVFVFVIRYATDHERVRTDAALADCIETVGETEPCRCWILNDCRLHEPLKDRSERKVGP